MPRLSIRHIALATACLALTTGASALAQDQDERRAAIQENLQSMDSETLQTRISEAQARRAEGGELRGAARTTLGTTLSEIDDADVQARLDTAEERMLQALADADPDTISTIANTAGAQASARLANAPAQYLNQTQIDTLVAAAAYAESITAVQVEMLLARGALQLEESYDQRDAAAIAAQFNMIGEKVLQG